MQQLLSIAHKAKHSRFYLWLLNRILWRVIPFNRAHQLWIQELSDNQVRVLLPYVNSNLNHLKGMHACALATLCEYACGIGLITRLNPSTFRLILKDIKVDYHSQGKSPVTVSFHLPHEVFQQEVLQPLTHEGEMMKTFVTEAYDSQQKLICTAQVTWQLKRWDKVKPSISVSS